MKKETITYTEYVKIGRWYVLRESLPPEHPESIKSLFSKKKL